MSTTMKNTMTSGEPAKDATPEDIEKHIEHTRADLGRTVEALSHKLDVRSQAQEKLTTVRDKAGSMARTIKMLAMRPVTMIAAGATVVAAGVAGAVAWKRRH
ncbi:DUF3618 domain-containing protein [Jiangella aurantiaca]|uniref:DUF3618 domain-containing protein n=1 Tax=Jiangella aurantiaca TaxID=2530373 RepID=A0A4R5A3T1_9ACTN|nr:DUF3618 domain-containing protein [Jiangella aurantiaca]TDD65324.1 DUF3618 domain-containing protein [Jiangella aurantiaca]